MSETAIEQVIEKLRAVIRGGVITPGDDAYDESRKVFLGDFDFQPGVIVVVADAADVAAVVDLAKETGVEFAVRSGGHSAAGHSSTNGGLVLDVRQMKSLDVDTEARTAWAGAGLTDAEYSEGVAAHCLATGLGDTGSVGLGGITLNGGIGYLVRKHGLTIDSLLAAEIVTADGKTRIVDEETEPDLFWAIRGGGGNFGVATRFLLACQPVDTIVGGILVLPATVETVTEFITEAESAPEELTTIANVMNCPPMPFVPEEFHGTLVIMGIMAWCGEVEAGQQVVDRFRELAAPIADMVHPIPYPEIYGPEDPEYRPLAVSRTMWADGFDSQMSETILEHLEDSDAPMRAVQIRVLGGAMTRISNDATAFAHRDRKLMINVASFYEGLGDRPRREAWVEGLAKILSGGDPAGYVGFLADEGPDRIRAAYPGPTWDRLRQIKSQYDPHNLFHRNQNIEPA